MGYTQVGSCPKCGAPVYAESPWMSILPPPSRPSCNCAGSQLGQVTYTTTTGTDTKPEGEGVMHRQPTIGDKSDIYREQIMPLIERLDMIAKEHDIPFVLVFQIDDGHHERSAYIPAGSHKEMKQLWKWLEQ